MHFDPDLELILFCDAPNYGLGAVLSHKFPDGSERPVGFVSRTLSNAEKNYSQIEKEALALVFGVKNSIHICLVVIFFYTQITNHYCL